MRDSDRAVVQHLTPIGDQIQVQGARRVGLMARPAEPRLDLMKRIQSVAHVENRLHQGHAVQVGRVVGIGPSGRAPPTRAPHHFQPGIGQSRQRRLEQRLRRSKAAGKVRSEGDDHRLVAMLVR